MEDTNSPWTPDAIRAATPHPKPEGAIEKIYNEQAGRYGPRLDLSPLERQALRHIADTADLLDVETPQEHGRGAARWLLIEVPPWLLQVLAEFESERAELEGGADAEPDTDCEDGADAEPDRDGEEQALENWTPDLPPLATPIRRAV